MTRKEAIERIKIILEECIEDEDAVSYVTSYDADALDMAIKALKQEPCEDCISRQAAIDVLRTCYDTETVTYTNGNEYIDYDQALDLLNSLPPIQPVATDTNVGDKISKFIDGLEEIFANLREKHVDDSVCGLCEYDGAYIGQSGDWCNECPGFERDDCFKLSDKTRKEWTDEIIKALPTVQPERKKGEWSDGYRWQRCSLCKQTGKKSWNYCPNCGADMRGEKDE